MKGYRTLLVNFAIAMGLAVLTWALKVDWTQYVSPTNAVLITTAANAFLRFLTDSPVGKSISASAGGPNA